MLRARLVTKDDFNRFDHIIALDRSHLAILTRMKPSQSKTHVSLMLDHIPNRTGQDVIDPYYGSDAGFMTTWQDVEAACAALAQTTLGPRPQN